MGSTRRHGSHYAWTAVAQVKIFGLREQLDPIKQRLSDAVHACVVEALRYPADKRAHRFFPLERSDFFYPAGRTERYTIIEISMFEGRSVEAKKQLIRLLFERVQREFGISPQDLEMTIFETPKHNWGFRGLPGDEHDLSYKVEV
jgi:phenylpyruvate tautomerase PptA (4-oxalocrotonate tautomerase family)